MSTDGNVQPLLARLGRDSAYLLISWPILMAAFVATITLVPLSASLLIVWVGFPLIFVTLGVARFFSALERTSQQVLLRRQVPTSSYRRLDPHTPLLRRAWQLVTDPQAWVDVVFCLFAWLVALATWCVAVAWWSVALTGLASPLLAVGGLDVGVNLGRWAADMPFARPLDVLGSFALGVLATATLPWAMRALAAAQSSLFAGILSSETLRRRVSQLETSRSAAQDAEAASLHKLERDLHDGPQQRLVRLQMDLGRALHQMDNDPARARTAVESSLTQAHATLDELRNLSRGIAPPLLVDRGLIVALDELAARSAIPVRFTTNLPRDHRPDELSARVQNAAFYLVSEALTNAAKHAGSGSAEVEVHYGEGLLRIVIRDGGPGGAHLTPGGGLSGLRDRLAGLDGRLDVYSPAGGPTVITALIPCQ